MPKIIIGFSYNKSSLFSSLIRFVTKSEVSHCYVRIPIPEKNTHMIFQSSKGLVNYMHESHFKTLGNIIVSEYEVDISEDQAQYAELFRIWYAGYPYSYLQILGFPWVWLGAKLGKQWTNPFYDCDQSFICVEVCARSLGLTDQGTMTPKDLREHILSKTIFTRLI
jgi:hypothetical protein